mgnify:CR=1 FL=1
MRVKNNGGVVQSSPCGYMTIVPVARDSARVLMREPRLSAIVSPGEETAMMTTEGKTLEVMIEIFCRAHHGGREELCPDCSELLDYALKRVEKCPFGENKPRCSDCTVHCYKPEMREKIRTVMKYSGPRMMYKHPVLTSVHYLKRK